MRAAPFAAALLAAAAIATVGIAPGCSDDGGASRPPRNPLADTSTPPAVTATLPGGARAPTAAPPIDSPTGTPAAVAVPDAETAIGLAIDRLAEWLGVPAPQLSVLTAVAITWPDACLGVAVPGRVCAPVATPGYRVALADAFGGAHTVHVAASGAALWMGETAAEGTVRAVDAAARRLALEPDTGGATLELRAAPGTRFDLGSRGAGGLAALAAGDRIAVRYDPAADGAVAPVLALAALREAGR